MRITNLIARAPGRRSGLGKNIVWLVISRFGAQGLMVLFTIVLAHRLGSQAFGAYAFIAAMVFIGNSVTTFGTDMLLIREIAADDDLSRLMPALVIQLVLSAGFITVTWIAAPLLPNQSPESVLGLQIYSLALLPLSFFSVFTTALRGKQRMDAYMTLNLFVSAVQLVMVWMLVRPGESIVRLAWMLLGVQCSGAVLGGILCGTQVSGFWSDWHFSWRKTTALARLCAPIALIAIVSILYQKLSVYMVSTLAGPTPTGWFSAALRMVEAAKTVHLAVFTALYPAMASAFKSLANNSAAVELPWNSAFRQYWKLLLFGSAAVSAGLFIFAAPLIQVSFGAEFVPAVAGLKTLAWILIPFTANTFLSLSILAARKEQTVMRVQLAGLVILACLNAWLIPKWGSWGACLSLVTAETIQVVIYLALWGRPQRKARQWAVVVSNFFMGDQV